MHTDFFFEPKQDTYGLDEVATATFSSLGISNFEKRESDNYVGGYYFTSVQDSLTIELAVNDYPHELNLIYWLSIEDFESNDESVFEQKINQYIAGLQKFAQIARVHDFGKKSMQVFELKSTG